MKKRNVFYYISMMVCTVYCIIIRVSSIIWKETDMGKREIVNRLNLPKAFDVVMLEVLMHKLSRHRHNLILQVFLFHLRFNDLFLTLNLNFIYFHLAYFDIFLSKNGSESSFLQI
jgi:hypothetical protein